MATSRSSPSRRPPSSAADRRIARAVRGGVDVFLQPIVDLTSGEIVGVEALARFADGRSPAVWFAEADSAGLGTALELAAVQAALARIGELPLSASLSVNVSAVTACSAALAEILAKVPSGRVVLEITEHVPVADYPALASALAGLRSRGVRLAVDDAGAGFASMQHVLQLKPDVVKLDASLVRGMDAQSERRAMVSAMVTFAAATGCKLVAEGIETAGELEAARELGVGCAQGFHLGMPEAAGPAEWQVRLPRKPRRPATACVRAAGRAVKPAAMFIAAAMSWQGIVAVAVVDPPRTGGNAERPPVAAVSDPGASGASESAEPAAASVPAPKPEAARKVQASVPASSPSPSGVAIPRAEPTKPVEQIVETVGGATTGLTETVGGVTTGLTETVGGVTETVVGVTETVTQTLGGLLRGVLAG